MRKLRGRMVETFREIEAGLANPATRDLYLKKRAFANKTRRRRDNTRARIAELYENGKKCQACGLPLVLYGGRQNQALLTADGNGLECHRCRCDRLDESAALLQEARERSAANQFGREARHVA